MQLEEQVARLNRIVQRMEGEILELKGKQPLEVDADKPAEPEKDWEILEFKMVKTGSIISILPDKKYFIKGGYGGISLNHILHIGACVDSGHFAIHSVRRLSDNTTWTVGMSAKVTNVTITIASFFIEDEHMMLRESTGGMARLSALRKEERKPLFTTADGVDVFPYDILYYYTQDGRIIHTSPVAPDATGEGAYWYSTREAAEKAHEEWLYNQPLISIKDLDAEHVIQLPRHRKYLEYLVKEKLQSDDQGN